MAEVSPSATVMLPLPPTANHCYKHTVVNGHQSNAYTVEYANWREYALHLSRDLAIPERTPLTVAIRLQLAPKLLHKADIDGFIKPILDGTITPRRDQWVMALDVQKRPADVGDEGVTVNVTWEV